MNPPMSLPTRQVGRYGAARRAGQHGFTLIEIAIGMLILGLSAAGLIAVLNKQGEQRKFVETRTTLAVARDALLAYVAANGRLPCPAVNGTNGQESVVAPGNPQCTAPTGLLPAVTLGVAQLDRNGLMVDAWSDSAGDNNGTFMRSVRYAIAPLAPTAPNALTAAGLGNPTLAGRTAVQTAFTANEGLFVCRSAIGIAAAGNRCGNAANTLSTNAAVVLWSQGANGAVPAAWGADEIQNANQAIQRVVISRGAMPPGALGGEFDDLVTWIPYPLVIDRLLTAGHVQ